jgi:hypothetical protein
VKTLNAVALLAGTFSFDTQFSLNYIYFLLLGLEDSPQRFGAEGRPRFNGASENLQFESHPFKL